MARSILDIQRLLATQAGYSPKHLSLTDDPADFMRPPGALPYGKRIAWLGDWNGALPMEKGVLDLCGEALKNFEKVECVVETIPPPMSMDELWDSWTTLRHWAVMGNLSDHYFDPKRRQQLKPEAQWEIERGLTLSALDIHKANVTRSQWYKALITLFNKYDFVALPSAQCFPFSISTSWPQQIDGHQMDTYHRWMQVVVPGSLSGCPILNLPAGFNKQGLPMGVQVIAPHRYEQSLLELGKAYEEALPDWKNRKPSCLTSQVEPDSAK